MSDHNVNALGAAVKALTQVVAPSVDPRNPLAVEQLRLVGMYLDFLAQQKPSERRLAWKDLSLQCELARQAADLLAQAWPQLCQRLREVLGRAQTQLDTPVSPVAHWERLHAELAEVLSEAIEAVSTGEAALRDALDTLVLSHAQGQLLLHRVWFLSYGFEARADQLPGLAQLLEGAPDI